MAALQAASRLKERAPGPGPEHQTQQPPKPCLTASLQTPVSATAGPQALPRGGGRAGLASLGQLRIPPGPEKPVGSADPTRSGRC